MAKIAIIRCEKNEDICPLTNCIKCLLERREGFSDYDHTELVGIFTCRCPGDNALDLVRILKNRGAEAIHFCTCTFAKKGESGWSLNEGGFCDHIDELIDQVHREAGIRCVKGAAHLPKNYILQVWE